MDGFKKCTNLGGRQETRTILPYLIQNPLLNKMSFTNKNKIGDLKRMVLYCL